MRALALLVCLFWAAPTLAAPAPIPLVDYRVQDADILFDAERLQSTLTWHGATIPIPGQQIVTDMVADGDRLFIASRTLFDGTLRLWKAERGALTRIPNPVNHGELLTQTLFISGPDLLLVAYDTHKQANQLFGRPRAARPGASWNKNQPTLKFGALYELNVPIFHLTLDDSEMLCGGETCFTLGKGEPVAHASPTGHSLLDVASDGHAAYGLYMKTVDDRQASFPGRFSPFYFTRQLPDGELKPVPASRIPYRFRMADGKPHFDALHSANAVDSYLADFQHLPNSGTALMGTSNRDGRQSWGQVYYLNGLLDLVSTKYQPPLLPLNAQQRTAIEKRITLEMQLLDRLLADKEALHSRRYSIERAPITVSMHLGRALRVMTRYRNEHPAPVPLQHYGMLKEQARSLAGTVSHAQTLPDGRQYLAFPKGVAFWADGVNLPHNMQTGWAEGLVMAYGEQLPAASQKLVRDIFSIWLEDEIAPRLGRNDWKWHYWWGLAAKGYRADSGISTHTPEYKGDSSFAHISYRTMDAMAALEAMKVLPDILPPGTKQYLKKGVEAGGLYPFTSEAFAANDLPCIPPRIARFYARYPSIYEMQNAVWALAALAQGCR